MTFDEARFQVSELIRQFDENLENDRFVIIDEAIETHTWGWVFYYTSERYCLTDEFAYAVAGNGPILVDKRSNKVYPLGTSRSPEQFIKRYEETGDPYG